METSDTVAAVMVQGGKKGALEKTFSVLLAEAVQEEREYRLAINFSTPGLEVMVGCNVKGLLRFINGCKVGRWDT